MLEKNAEDLLVAQREVQQRVAVVRLEVDVRPLASE